MTKRNGFTLIELLAVILILGIIALIAIPTVTNIITESKVGAWKSTANNIVSAYEQYYQLCQMKGETCVTEFKAADDEATTGVNEINTGANVKSVIGLKGDMPDTFTTLKLNTNGDAMVTFTVDSITCSNVNESNALVEMTCEKN